MSHQVASLPLEVVRQGCVEESKRYRYRQPFDPVYCLELLRRALMGGDEVAWEFVYQQYADQVARWVRRHPAFAGCGEKVDYFVNGAFARFAQAVTPEKFQQFKRVEEALKYLKLCVGSTILDYVRAQGAQGLAELDEENVPAITAPLESLARKEEYGRKLWQIIKSHLKSQEEQVVIECVFVFGMKSSQVVNEYPYLFTDVERVYRVLENVLKRLRRDPQLEEWFEANM
jgi:hypothetical protein